MEMSKLLKFVEEAFDHNVFTESSESIFGTSTHVVGKEEFLDALKTRLIELETEKDDYILEISASDSETGEAGWFCEIIGKKEYLEEYAKKNLKYDIWRIVSVIKTK